MAEQPQTIVQPAAAPNKPLGARNQSNLQSIFKNSPIYAGTLTDEERKKLFQELCLDGDVVSQGGPLAGPGLGVNSFNRDFTGAPDLTQVETGGAGKPASPFVPSLTSPGPGSGNAADQPVYNGTLPDAENNIEFGSGLGGTTSPSETTPNIANQGILETYISGKSYLGSDGQQ